MNRDTGFETRLLVGFVFGLVILAVSLTSVVAQSADLPGFRVVGRHLYDRFGEKVILVGVNKMVIWTDRDGLPAFPEIAKTGANAVRIIWLTEGSAEELDIAISNSISNQLIPMIDCHDSTGKWEELQTCVDYWVRPDVVSVIKKHEAYLLINIANECGKGVQPEWEFKAAYELAVNRMRAAGIHVPLIIDAQGYGQNIDDLQKNGPYLIEADPDHNLMFSIHMWWPSAWRGQNVDQLVIDEIAESVEMELPLIVGEFAHEAVGCTCCIPYLTIIEQCHLNEIGYFPWSWGPGNGDCAAMDMTEDGTFDTLNDWGLEVAITDPYSIKNIAVRPSWVLDATPVPTPTPVPTATPQPVPEGLLSLNRPVEVSSVENEDLAGIKAVDGQMNSRWSSAWSSPQTLTLDLGEIRDIARIVLEWETAYGKEYKLQVSEDGETWTDVVHVSDSDGGRDDHVISARGRYVRMEGLKRATEWGFSLWEFWVFDNADTPLPEADSTGDVGKDEELLPDLIVTDISWEPPMPVHDKGLTFSATVKNAGSAATDVPFRCAFLIDGQLVSWSTALSDPLAPGASVTMTASDGLDGDKLWKPEMTGPFVVLAWVDDDSTGSSGLVEELDEHNNMLTAFDYVRLYTPVPPTPTATVTPVPEPSAPTVATQEATEATTTPVATLAPVSTPSDVKPAARIGIWLGLIAIGVLVVVVVGIIVLRRAGK